MSGDYQVRALARGLAILTSFTLTHPEQSLTAITTRSSSFGSPVTRRVTVRVNLRPSGNWKIPRTMRRNVA
jgi:hypothetical protein